MNYKQLEAVIAGVTGEQGPFPLQEALVNGDIREFSSERLAAFKIPVHICCRQEQLPRIASGKIDKKKLRAEQVERRRSRLA